MRRRELIAGALGAGVVGGGGYLALRGPDLRRASDDQDWSDDPIEVTTVAAPGSDAGSVLVPDGETLYVIEFFATTCRTCTEMKPEVVDAERRAEGATFLSVTNEQVGDHLPEEELVAYWDDVGGAWTLGVDPRSKLFVRYDGFPVPTTIVVDGVGRVHWRHRGRVSADGILEGVDTAKAALA